MLPTKVDEYVTPAGIIVPIGDGVSTGTGPPEATAIGSVTVTVEGAAAGCAVAIGRTTPPVVEIAASEAVFGAGGAATGAADVQTTGAVDDVTEAATACGDGDGLAQAR